jgi:hypothetical protein
MDVWLLIGIWLYNDVVVQVVLPFINLITNSYCCGSSIDLCSQGRNDYFADGTAVLHEAISCQSHTVQMVCMKP